MSAGTVRAGAVVSWTVTSNVSVVVFPELSVPVQDTVDVPSGNVAPDAGTQPKDGFGSTTSAAEAAYVTAAPLALVASAVMSSGSVRLGPTESRTVTTNEPVVVSPAESVTEQTTV